jgi:predicted dehydrogenase
VSSGVEPAPLRVVLVGFGWFAELLVGRAFPNVPELSLAGVVDLSAARRSAAAAAGLHVYHDLPAALADPAVDGVIVMTPHDTHREVVSAAIAAGKHVFCEKAFAVTTQDARAMTEAAASTGVTLLVGHMQKLFPPYARVVELARSGTYGDVVGVHVDGLHWSPVFPGWWRTWRSCGGLLYWTGIHDLDTINHVVGSVPDSVFAMTGPKTEPYVEYDDQIVAVLRYPGGVLASLHVSCHHPVREFADSFGMSVLLESGGIRFVPESQTVEHAGRSGPDRLERGEVVVERFGSVEATEDEAYTAELRHFARVVRGREASRLTPRAATAVVATLEALYRSVESGRVEPVGSG